MRKFDIGNIFLAAIFLVLSAGPVHAQPGTRAILTPFVCEPAGENEVSAKFINKGGLLLNIKTDQTADKDNAGGVLDRIDGLAFNTLDLDVSGGCQSGFAIVFFGSDPITGDFTASTATCADAITTSVKGGFTHLHLTPASFGYPSSPKIIQIYILQNTTTAGARNVLIKNVVVNNGSTTPVMRLGGCQL